MIRLFKQHEVRKQDELEGLWDFETVDGEKFSVPVPGCWEQVSGLLTYRGKGTYIQKINVQKSGNIRLEFKGVSHTAKVFFDDEFLCSHYNAYTGFCAVVKNVEKGLHEVKVEVDNSFSEESALHVPNDYYTYGGIIRPVVFEEIPDVYIKRIHFAPEKIDKEDSKNTNKNNWQAKIEIELENLSDEEKEIKILIEIANHNIEKVLNVGSSTIFELEILENFEDVEEWNVLEPKLYMLKASIMTKNCEQLDDLIERVGFRDVSLNGRKIFLNGKSVFLKGFNRHEDYGTLGCAVPFQVMTQDIDMILDMGGNAIRTCHYPNDERFLDLCDEKGILIWEENHARGLDLEKMSNPNFDKQCHDCINEMISQHFNHPSIIIWGILNECASETEVGREKYKMQYEQIRELDKSRPVTSATCRHFTDICLDLPDIVSFNMYSGWYEDVDVLERHTRQMKWIDEASKGIKPVIVSEFGAGAIYGYRDRGHGKWSEERQADIIRENIDVYSNDERICGIFIWQFADCKVTDEKWFASRAKGHNNKGVVDEYRRPKEAYYTVKEMYSCIRK